MSFDLALPSNTPALQAPRQGIRILMLALGCSTAFHLIIFSYAKWPENPRLARADRAASLRVRIMPAQAPEPRVAPSEHTRSRDAPAQNKPKTKPPPPSSTPSARSTPSAQGMTHEALEALRAYRSIPTEPGIDWDSAPAQDNAIRAYTGPGQVRHVQVGERCYEYEQINALDSLRGPPVWRVVRCGN